MRPDLALFQVFEQEGLFDRQQHKVVEPPSNEVPACTMPDAGSSPDKEHVEQLPRLPLSVTTQRDIDVIPEPPRQGDMPAPPELGNAARDIRQVKVGRAVKAEQRRQTVTHLTIAGKVKV